MVRHPLFEVPNHSLQSLVIERNMVRVDPIYLSTISLPFPLL
jgi:hypothetical protein